MIEQHIAVTDRNHVVMEDALVDHIGILRYEYRAFVAQAMQACYRLAGFQRLTGWKTFWRRRIRIELDAAVDKHLDTGGAVART